MDIYAVANMMKVERKTIFDIPMRVTFYARVSTTREEQENSIEHQIEFFINLIQVNKNWEYVDGYIDRVRGEHAENRENFMRMIEDGKAGAFDLILTKEVSRFARDTIDSLAYTRELLRAGVGVLFQNDSICTVDTDSELRLTIMSSIATDEVRKLSERVRWGHSQSIKNGRVLGNNRIFGYDKVDCKLVINEEEAEMVRLIFDMYSTGDNSVRKIERELELRGYRGRNGTPIHHNTISNIIQNPKYKGYYCGNKVRVVDHRTKEQKFLPEEEWVMFKDDGTTVPAIVSEEIWDKCNRIFKERSIAIKSRGRSFKDRSVFTGKVICAEHSTPMWRTSYSNSRNTGHSIYQWICSEKKRRGTKNCRTFAIMEGEIYSILSDVYKGILSNIDGHIDSFMEAYKNIAVSRDYRSKLSEIEAAIGREEKKKDKLLELYMDEAISKAEFTQRNNSMNEKIGELQKEADRINREMEKSGGIESSIKKIEDYLKHMYIGEGEMSKLQIDEMSKLLLDKILVKPVDDKTMELDVILLVPGIDNVRVSYSKDYRRSGHIFLNIWAEQQYNFSRFSKLYKNYNYGVCYIVRVGA